MVLPEKATDLKRYILAALAALAVLAIPSTASASPIRECGNYVQHGAKNVTTRNFSCANARRAIRDDIGGFYDYGNHSERRKGWACRVRIPNPRSWWVDVRCTVGNLGFNPVVVRFQTQSGE